MQDALNKALRCILVACYSGGVLLLEVEGGKNNNPG